MGFDANTEYDVEVTFDEQKYEWLVYYYVQAPEDKFVLDGGKKVGIRCDNGMISYYSRK